MPNEQDKKEGKPKDATKADTFNPHRDTERQADRANKQFAQPGTEKRG